MNGFDAKKLTTQMTLEFIDRIRRKVEATYCLEHNQFAKLVIEDENEPSWRIEGCCRNLLEKAGTAVSGG